MGTPAPSAPMAEDCARTAGYALGMPMRRPGRGRRFPWWRAAAETLLTHAYAGDWPGRLWGRVPGATAVEVLRFALPGPRLRLAFLSDLHIGPTTPRAVLDAAFEAVSDFEPDILALGGDYVYLEATAARLDELEARVRAVPAAARVAVMGNHDLWTDHDAIEAALRRAGVEVLVNRSVRLGDVTLIGLDEPWTGEADADHAWREVSPDHFQIALSHAPEGLPMVAGRGASLLLCGHTHGGQLALPGRRPMFVPGRYGWRHPAGMYEVEGLHMFVSRGLGGVSIPVRTHAPPDVALFSLGGD